MPAFIIEVVARSTYGPTYATPAHRRVDLVPGSIDSLSDPCCSMGQGQALTSEWSLQIWW